MAQAHYEGSYPNRDTAGTTSMEDVSGWAVGLTFFASLIMLLIGSFHIIQGLAAVLDDSFYAIRPGYALEVDVQTWGWIHMIGGMVVMVAGGLLLTGNIFARIIATLICLLSAVGSFASIPYYPVWSILLIALNIAVIWAIASYGRFAQSEME